VSLNILEPSGPVAGLYRNCLAFTSYLDRYITVKLLKTLHTLLMMHGHRNLKPVKHRLCLFDHNYCVTFIFNDLH